MFGTLPDLSGLPASAGPVPDPAARAAWVAMTVQERENFTLIYANLGKAIAAYERLLQPGPAQFDRYAEAILKGDALAAQQILTEQATAGLKLFIGNAECIQYHNGALFTENHFHNTGIPAAAGLPEDLGRASGAQQVQADEFNCLSPYSDAPAEACSELRYMIAEGEDDEWLEPPALLQASP